MPQSEDVLSASCLQWAPTHLLQTVELASPFPFKMLSES